jgi:predicted Abi (CAAX) family protease
MHQEDVGLIPKSLLIFFPSFCVLVHTLLFFCWHQLRAKPGFSDIPGDALFEPIVLTLCMFLSTL